MGRCASKEMNLEIVVSGYHQVGFCFFVLPPQSGRQKAGISGNSVFPTFISSCHISCHILSAARVFCVDHLLPNLSNTVLDKNYVQNVASPCIHPEYVTCKFKYITLFLLLHTGAAVGSLHHKHRRIGYFNANSIADVSVDGIY